MKTNLPHWINRPFLRSVTVFTSPFPSPLFRLDCNTPAPASPFSIRGHATTRWRHKKTRLAKKNKKHNPSQSTQSTHTAVLFHCNTNETTCAYLLIDILSRVPDTLITHPQTANQVHYQQKAGEGGFGGIGGGGGGRGGIKLRLLTGLKKKNKSEHRKQRELAHGHGPSVYNNHPQISAGHLPTPAFFLTVLVTRHIVHKG